MSAIPFGPTCQECGDHFEPDHIGQSFCTDSCAEAWVQRLYPIKENR
jgi:hypothetical protein